MEAGAGAAADSPTEAGAGAEAAAERAESRARTRAAALAALYAGGGVDDVELLVGALLERPVEGGVLGETVAAIVEEQFRRARAGDRFWFESADAPLAGALDALFGDEEDAATLAAVAAAATARGAPDAEAFACAGGRAGGAAALRNVSKLGALLSRVTGVDVPAARGEALRVLRRPGPLGKAAERG